jgi:hypothetical protein
VHKEHEVLLKLEAAGLNDELAQKVIDSKGNDLATKVMRLIQNGGFEPSTPHKQARAIMGRNFFCVEEAIKHFGVNPSRQQLAYLAEVPFTEEVLKSCKDTHVLVAVFPMSILDIRGKVERKLFYSHDEAWYNKQALAKDKGEVGWQLVRKVPVADSTNKTWNEQQALLSKDEETPKAQVVVYTIIGHFLAVGERLFENIYIRCSDLDSDGGRVDVGLFDAEGLRVGNDWGGVRDGGLGVSSARKQ